MSRVSLSVLWSGLATALVAVAFSTGNAQAEPGTKTVVELFTSQGCSSCPPADKLQKKFSRRDDVIALTYNVDYWDYLGWKDTLADPAYSTRQRDYARARGDGQVYTPQTVINGTYHAVGSQEASIERAISKVQRSRNGASVPLKMRSDGDTLVIRAGAAPEGTTAKPATIWLALVKRKKTVKIDRGENHGRKITYHSVVTSLTPVGHWTGQAVTVKLPKYHLQKAGADGCTVLLQIDKAGPILAAAEMKNW